MKLIGGVLGAYNEPTETSASGIWKLSEQYVYTTKSNFPRFNPENVFDLTKLSSLQTKLNGNEFSLSQDSTAVAFTFKDDGTKMYVLGSANDKIYQYTLSTAWNVATATYDNISSANVNAQDNIMNGIQFKDDGTKVYLCGTVNSKVFQYNLTEAWNIGTLSYANIATPNIATTGNGTVYLDDFVITPNGNVVIYIGASASASPIYQRMIRHSLSESWNIATSTWNGNITATMNFEDKPYEVDLGTQLFIGNSGKNIFTLITNQITQHNLDSSWNIRDFDKGVSTVVSNNKIYYNQQIVSSSNTESSIKMPISTVLPFDGSGETDIEFKSDGTKMYVLCDIGSTALVREYDLPVAWELNSYNPWPGYKFEYAGLTYYESANASNMTVYGFYFKSDGTKLYSPFS